VHLATLAPLPLIGSPLFHLQAVVARNAYTLP
jgi:hypothetical protein